MPISKNALEEAILCLLCFNTDHAPHIALKIQDITLFSNRTHQKIAEIALPYVQEFGTAPAAALEYLLEVEYRKGEEGKLLAQTVELISRQAAGIQPEFVISEMDRFFEQRKLETALIDSMESLKTGDLDAARSAIYQSVAPALSKQASGGLWLKNVQHVLGAFNNLEDPEFFSSGIDALDQRGVRPGRKMLMFLIAAKGKGKSWWLINAGKAAFQHHHSVLHITLEMSKEKTLKRYIQSLFALTSSELQQIKTPVFLRDQAGNFRIDVQVLEREPILAKRKEIVTRIAGMKSYPELVIEEFPTGTLTTEHLHLYLDSLKRDKGFVPDMLIIDYADLMYIDPDQFRIDTGRVYKDLRGIGMARNMAVLTASQGNRESEETKLVTGGNVAEDWSKNGTADGVLTFSQTREEYMLGLARIFVDKYRDASDRFITLISQAYSMGQFALDSVFMNMDVSNTVNSLTGS